MCTQAGVLAQIDTYFQVSSGRLKLREFSRVKAELIYYQRNEGKGERWSKYYICPVKRPSTLKSLLGLALGTRTVVRKSRRVFFYKGARIHLDSVFRLGHFIEIEVLVKKSRDQARSVFAEINRLFSVKRDDIIVSSYADLLRKKSKMAPRLKKGDHHTRRIPA